MDGDEKDKYVDIAEAVPIDPAAEDNVLPKTELPMTVMVLPMTDEMKLGIPELADVLVILPMLPLVGREVAKELAVLTEFDVLADTLLGPFAVTLLVCWVPPDDTSIDVIELDCPVSYDDDCPFDTPAVDRDVSDMVCVLETSLAVIVGVLYIGARDCDTEYLVTFEHVLEQSWTLAPG
ncbi:hypothetical protein LTR29_013017 [Friedmanniomyces endolithicus]|nr:hypothetical protein LTR29_013017 [Friedmanniomyces endolithicus]